MSGAKVKICGLTTAEDARLALSLGADYLGVIFAESPRRVTVARAKEIRAAVPSAALVGVFRDQPLADVVDAALSCDLDLVQLHGGENPAYCDEVLERAAKPAIKAFRAVRVPTSDQLAAFRTTSYFLFDCDGGAARGDAARGDAWDDVAAARRLGFRMFVAGGIDSSNVRAILSRTGAFAVDVCRGVERAPGIKDPLAMERFMVEARA
jgi:phosphoribosylanthranilate isomerase